MFATEKMPSESTPLITTVHVVPRRQRHAHHTVRRFFTIASGATLVCGFILFALHAFVIEPLHFHHPKGTDKSHSIPYEKLKEILLETPSSEHAREWSKYYTAGPHLAGKNYSQVRCLLRLGEGNVLTRTGRMDYAEMAGMGHRL